MSADKIDASGMSRLAIVSAWIGDAPSVVSSVRENHATYANQHRYSQIFLGEKDVDLPEKLIVDPPYDIHWIKIPAIRLALRDHDFAFWIDADSVFHDFHQPLSDLTSTGKDFTFTGDINDICNTGHLLFRQSGFTAEFLDNWEKLKSIPFPKLNTTHQGISGHVGDQVAMNYLLAGGVASSSAVEATAVNLFNKVNGWRGNKDREHRFFSKTHAPTAIRNLKRARGLLETKLRDNVELVVQSRLNAYPWWGPAKSSGNQPGPIIHFVPPWKVLWEEYFSGLGPRNPGE